MEYHAVYKWTLAIIKQLPRKLELARSLQRWSTVVVVAVVVVLRCFVVIDVIFVVVGSCCCCYY